ncbi:TRAP transporter large permease subunit [Paracoccus denitrificans]|jgi:tripartite ATP-independent transporter DctM subunit|uniref:TRAP transporter large permease protein n=1 Tax=Paracoccus denitrificans (strain Pd 1222) TaxID=318586 RepID=A1B7G3_PARDP|nr:TRAP transporter large permease subunit [Paracoccus denitrificans]ABL71457.1 TRAP dicarboxylate transporter, DctM subunit [Paracoccus denitrificans PD1222]MBB4629655.1 tripartite ATP-independent transporter DctM subunit [Paracoccus denitrificans]MCU7430674.1 TRAP transporter large permease subunit [Paracoccus denitrificans]QAR28068.1 TRAP transporter large permease subunit [Paracoccus denitrificans]UPV97793.1 TRAP transporter large permease subunit [Paracoccus denitrificans]
MILLVFILSLLAAILIGIPIAFGLILSGIVMMWWLGALDWQLIALQMTNGADSFPLLAIPFFMLAGEAMNAGGISKRLVNFGMTLVGHKRGGLGYVTIVAALLLASLSGSAVADTAVLAGMLLPIMRQAGYDINHSGGLIASGGIIAPILPPSIGYIVFGVAGGVSITKLFMAGIAPGIMMALTLAVTWWFLSRNSEVSVPQRAPLREVLKAAGQASLAFILPVIIIVGLKAGIFTPTEAGVVACVYAIFIGMFVYRELHPKMLYHVMIAAVRTTASVMLLVAAASITAYLVAIANIPGVIGDMLSGVREHPVLLMLVIMTIILVVGTALDFIPTILILTPVLLPIAKSAGIDPVYFGVMFIMAGAIGLLTPPVGAVLNVVCAVGNMRYTDAVRGVVPFLIVQAFLILLLALFPQLVIVPANWFY